MHVLVVDDDADTRTLLDVVPIGIAIAEGPACRSIRVNASFARVLRLAADANASLTAPAGERPAYKVFRERKQVPAEELPMQYAASRGVEVRGAEIDVVHPDGRVVNLFGHAAPLFDEQGRPRGAVGAFLDITERKREQERLLHTERL